MCLYKVVSGVGSWSPMDSISYDSFVGATEAMSMNDLYMYALRAFSMSKYSDEKPWVALEESFKPSSHATNNVVINGLEDKKCITHNVFEPLKDDIICIKNYIPLRITIVPYSKVSKEEKEDIINNIYKALSQNFNA